MDYRETEQITDGTNEKIILHETLVSPSIRNFYIYVQNDLLHYAFLPVSFSSRIIRKMSYVIYRDDESKNWLTKETLLH